MRNKKILRFVPLFIPILLSHFAFASEALAPVREDEGIEARMMIIERELLQGEAQKIDAYFKERSMPLEGYGMKMAMEARKQGIDWRLLPAIAVRESSGGKFACANNAHNPFGWGSCRIKFNSIDEAIEVVAWNLGAKNPKTKRWYEGESALKLKSYNGTVVPAYPEEVLWIMGRIGG